MNDMVRKVKKANENLHVCIECGFAYRESTTAKKCENFCKKYHACSLEITKNAVKTS